MKLKDNTIYTNTEMAEWFGIKKNSFVNHKAEKLKELNEYAEYKSLRGKVHIIKVKDPARTEYDKHSKPIKRYVEEHFLDYWMLDEFESCSRVAAKLCIQFREDTGAKPEDSKESSFYYYTTVERDKHFPKIAQHKEWCKMYGITGAFADEYTRAENIYEQLTEDQQQEFYSEFFKRYKKDKVADAILTLNEKYEKGALKDSEIWNEAWEEFNTTVGAKDQPYKGFLKDMADKFMCDWMIKGTKVTEMKEGDFEF